MRNITLEPVPEFCLKPRFYRSFTESGTYWHSAFNMMTDVVSYVSVNGGDGRVKLGDLTRQTLQVAYMYACIYVWYKKEDHQKTNLGFLSQVCEQITLSAGTIDCLWSRNS